MGLSDICDRLCSARWSRMLFSFIIGAVIGVAVSFTVNCTLVEISINGFFAVYFGILFILIATLILWRVWNSNHPRRGTLIAFSTLVLISGFLCFMLEKDWFVSLTPKMKIPMYSILGIAVCFALLFSIIDLINYCYSLCNEYSKPPVESEAQVYLVVTTAVIMGFSFGLIFGLLDVEDEKLSHLRVALLREESICYPIGAVVGGLAAVLNQWFRENSETQFTPLAHDELEEDF